MGELTPAELSEMMIGHEWRQTERECELLAQAWYAEAFARQKKLPDLGSLLRRIRDRWRASRRPKVEELEKVAEAAAEAGIEGPERGK